MQGTGKGATRKARAALTRRAILEKALELFRLRGYDATSLDAIAGAAGVTKGAFYAHFESKASLIPEYLGDLDLDYRRFHDSLPEGLDAAARLSAYADAIAGILGTRLGLDLLRALYRAELAREVPLAPFVSRDRELYRVFRDILESGMRAGRFRPDLDAALVSDHLVMSIRSMVFEWCARAPGFDLRAELAAHVSLLVEGMRA